MTVILAGPLESPREYLDACGGTCTNQAVRVRLSEAGAGLLYGHGELGLPRVRRGLCAAVVRAGEVRVDCCKILRDIVWHTPFIEKEEKHVQFLSM